RQRNEPAAAARVQRRDDAALSTQREAVRRVLDVAPAHDPAVVNERGRTDGKARIRRVRTEHRVDRGSAQRRPIDIPSCPGHPLTYGLPSAAGARTRPTSPATARIVTA